MLYFFIALQATTFGSSIQSIGQSKKPWTDPMLSNPKTNGKHNFDSSSMNTLVLVALWIRRIVGDDPFDDEAMCKKRKLNYTQWHVIGFVTFDKKKFTFDIWWLNSSFLFDSFVHIVCSWKMDCTVAAAVVLFFSSLLIKQSNQVLAQYQYWNHLFDELDGRQ